MDELFSCVRRALEKRGFEVYAVSDAAAAREKALSLIPEGSSVGIGGSMTVRQLGLAEALEQGGHEVWWHWTTPEGRAAVLENARHADVYLASANAVTANGQLVNTDGTGNRVSTLLYGPALAVLIIGRNKLVDGGLNEALARIRRDACPPNARRLRLDTPCAHTGRCDEAHCGDDCMCRGTAILHRPMRGQRMAVILVDEALGY